MNNTTKVLIAGSLIIANQSDAVNITKKDAETATITTSVSQDITITELDSSIAELTAHKSSIEGEISNLQSKAVSLQMKIDELAVLRTEILKKYPELEPVAEQPIAEELIGEVKP